MDDLLKHLLVRWSDGTLTPATYPAERPIDKEEETQTPCHFHTRLAPKAQGSQTQSMDDCEDPVRAMGDFTPPPSAQPLYSFSGLPNLMSIDDFEKENPVTPKPKIIQITPTNVTLVCATRINNLWVNHGIRPEFTYGWLAQQCVSVKLQFLDEEFQSTGPFASKRHAKEEICKLALPRMQALDKQLIVRKRKLTEASEPVRTGLSTALLNSENFVTLLQDWSQSIHVPLPEYSEARTATTPIRFQCSVRIANGPLTPFGSKTDLYPNKNEAKRAAAREAIEWLRDQSEPSPLLKRPKVEDSRASLSDPGQTGLTQILNDIDIDATDAISLPQQVHELALSLGFKYPNFAWQATTPPPDVPIQPHQSGTFVNMAVTFGSGDVDLEPRLAGTVVRVEHVYGRKKAREMCCRELLSVLESIRTSRME